MLKYKKRPLLTSFLKISDIAGKMMFNQDEGKSAVETWRYVFGRVKKTRLISFLIITFFKEKSVDTLICLFRLIAKVG